MASQVLVFTTVAPISTAAGYTQDIFSHISVYFTVFSTTYTFTSTAPNPRATNPPDSEKGATKRVLAKSAIIGIMIGVLLIVITICIAGICWRRRRNGKRDVEDKLPMPVSLMMPTAFPLDAENLKAARTAVSRPDPQSQSKMDRSLSRNPESIFAGPQLEPPSTGSQQQSPTPNVLNNTVNNTSTDSGENEISRREPNLHFEQHFQNLQVQMLQLSNLLQSNVVVQARERDPPEYST